MSVMSDHQTLIMMMLMMVMMPCLMMVTCNKKSLIFPCCVLIVSTSFSRATSTQSRTYRYRNCEVKIKFQTMSCLIMINNKPDLQLSFPLSTASRWCSPTSLLYHVMSGSRCFGQSQETLVEIFPQNTF